MLVWNAMPSITPMISDTVRDDELISRMVATTSVTTAPPWVATAEALSASWLAWRALSAFWRTIEVISSMLDAVSSSELACSSVRCDRSALPAAICLVAAPIDSEPWRTRRTVSVNAACMRARPSSRRPISSRRSMRTGCVRSPAAMRSNCASVAFSGPTMARSSSHAHPTDTTSASTMAAITRLRIRA